MIALTQEKRDELANYAKERLASHVIHGGCSDEWDIFKIALASLTAETIGWGLRSLKDSGRFGSFLNSSPREQSYLDYQPHDYENVPLYTAPPVPEVNTSNELTALLRAIDSFQAIQANDRWDESGKWDDAYGELSEAAIKAAPLIKRLNGLGE